MIAGYVPANLAEGANLEVTVADATATRLITSRPVTFRGAFIDELVLISTDDLAAGEYVVAARLAIAGAVVSDTAKISVRDPPAIALGPVSLARDGDAVVATFSVEAETADDVGIDSYQLTVGQGGPVIGSSSPVLKHRFPLLAATYDLTLVVTDVLGAVFSETYRFRLDRDDFVAFRQDPDDDDDEPTKPPPEAADTCGCKEMIIHTQRANSAIYCAKPPEAGRVSHWDYLGCTKLDDPKDNPCQGTDVAYQCQLGRQAPQFLDPGTAQRPNYRNVALSRLAFAFEVEAVLQPNSNAKLCKEGQYAQGTSRAGQGTFNNPPAQDKPDLDADGVMMLPNADGSQFSFNVVKRPERVPARGAGNYGADDFDAESVQKRYDGNARIIWLDIPRTTLVYERAPLPGGQVVVWSTLSSDNEFISFVTGPTGTCWCRFELDNMWSLFDPTVKGAGLKLSANMPNGLKCTIR